MSSVWDEQSQSYVDQMMNHWSKATYQNGSSNYESGNGSLSIDQILEGTYTFTYGEPLYLNSYLDISVSNNGGEDSNNGEINIQSTVTAVPFVLPCKAQPAVLVVAEMAVAMAVAEIPQCRYRQPVGCSVLH